MPRSSPRFSAASEAVSPPVAVAAAAAVAAAPAAASGGISTKKSSGSGGGGRRKQARSRHEEEKKDAEQVGAGTFSGAGAAAAGPGSSPGGQSASSHKNGSATVPFVVAQIRHALDESTRCVALQPALPSDVSFCHFAGASSTAPLSCSAGYLSYSPYHRRWDLYYRSSLSAAGNTGFAISSTPTLVAHAHRVVVNSARKSGENGSGSGGVGQPASSSDYPLISTPSVAVDDGTIAPPPKVLQTTLRLIELRRMLELVVAQWGGGGGGVRSTSSSLISHRVQTRQMAIVSLGMVLADLLGMEGGKKCKDDGDATSWIPMQSIRYVKLLRSASAEAIRRVLSLPIECSVGGDTNDATDADANTIRWRVVLADSYEAQLGPRSGKLSPTDGCQCNQDQIDYVHQFVQDCLALDTLVDLAVDDGYGGYGERKMAARVDDAHQTASSTTAAEDEYDSDVQIIEGPSVAAVAASPKMPPGSEPAPLPMSLKSTGRRPKRMRESVRRSPSLDGSMGSSRPNTASAAIAATAAIASTKATTDAKAVDNAQQLLPSPDRDGKNVQLYASTFGTPQADQGRCEGGRPKRKIKQVIRFNADPLPYKVQRTVAETAKSGDGFNCPACLALVSYDATQCPSCHLRCQYAPGAGVQIIKERGEVLSNASDGIKFGKTEAAMAAGGPVQAGGQTSGEDKRVLRTRPKRNKAFAKGTSAPVESSSQPRQSKRSKAVVAKPKSSKPVAQATTQTKRIINPDNLPVSAQRVFAVAPGIVECEACLKLFSQSSIQGHRRRLHGLRADQLACAHCELTFPTKEERQEHIRTEHPGKPIGVNAKTIAQHKIYQYLCPCCKDAFSLVDLETHLAEVHSIKLDKVRSDVLWLCPFCPGGRRRKSNIFPDHRSLKDHIEETHEECQLLGAILFVPGGKRFREKKKSRIKSPTPYIAAVEPLRRYFAHSGGSADSEDEEEDDASEVISFVLHRFSVKPVDLLNSSSISTELLTSNPSMADILTTVDTTIEALEEKIEASELSDESLEKEYADEVKLYTRTIRERGVKAESEKLEKEKYKEVCDEQQMMWEYENRGKKRSANALEEEALLARPIKYEKKTASASTSTKRGACCVGEGCRLCNGTHASDLITEAEMIEVGGDIEKVIPIPFGRTKASEGKSLMPMSQLLMPVIKEIEIDDYLADSDEEQKKKKETKEKDTRPSRRKQKAEEASAELDHLCRLRHTLAFVDEYNQTFLPAIQRNPKNYYV